VAKSLKKRTQEKKQKPLDVLEIDLSETMSDTIDLSDHTAATPSYINMSYSGSTITLDPAWLGATGSTTTTISGVTNWSAHNIGYTSTYSGSNVRIDTDGIVMQEGTDIRVGNRSLLGAIDKIEERLSILHPNVELEEKWEDLKNLRKAYIDLEKEILEKERMWKILKEK
jgi:hypothetical protein